MSHINYEIKARISKEHQNKIREILKINKAKFLGIYHQIDSYLNVEKDKQKIRKSYLEDRLVENELIEYQRENKKDAKISEPTVYDLNKQPYLERIRKKMYGKLIEVEKQRETYFIENVNFHIDDVKDLGAFVEIKAQSELDEKGESKIPSKKLKEQCNHYKNLFKIKDKDLIADSYSDMLLRQKESKN